MRYCCVWLIAWIFFVGTAGNAAPATVTVTLFEAHPGLKSIEMEGPAQISSPVNMRLGAGKFVVFTEHGQVVLKPSGALKPSMHSREIVLHSIKARGLSLRYNSSNARRYPGTLRLSSAAGFIKVTDELPAIDYVTSVVGSETLPGWPVEMLKAQAVLTQTRLFRHAPGDYLGDSTQREAFLGTDYERPGLRKAVRNVWGQMLLYDGRPAYPLYHSTCGGGTSDGGEYFGKTAGSIPYLRPVACFNCKNSPFYIVKRSDVPERIFADRLDAGDVHIVSKDKSGRPLLVDLGNKKHESGYKFWLQIGQKLGWDKMPGTRYSIDRAPHTVTLVSNGAGHGVGMCQWGAAELASERRTYKQILQYYFPGTSLSGL